MARMTVQRRTKRLEVSKIAADAPADLEQALFDLGIEVTGGDDDEVKGRCPEHEKFTGKEDANPSWSVNRSTGYFNCFSCPSGGSFITLVCSQLDIGPFEAARWIRQYGLNMEQVESLPEYEERNEIQRKASKEVTEASLAQFSHPTQEALDVRGITADAARLYGILWDKNEKAWIFPIRMVDGTLLGWQRKGEKRLGAEDVVKNYPRRVLKSATLFGADIFPVGEPAVVLESPLDCARLLTAEMAGGVSTWGAKFSAEQMRVLRDLTDEVVWATDNDEAGRTAARLFRDGDPKAKRPAYSRRFRVRFLNYAMLPEGSKDIGEPGMEDIFIKRAVRGAQHALLADLGEADVDRGTSGLSNSRRGADGKGGTPATGRRTGLPNRGQHRYGKQVRRK